MLAWFGVRLCCALCSAANAARTCAQQYPTVLGFGGSAASRAAAWTIAIDHSILKMMEFGQLQDLNDKWCPFGVNSSRPFGMIHVPVRQAVIHSSAWLSSFGVMSCDVSA
jgi:hypothetical protein